MGDPMDREKKDARIFFKVKESIKEAAQMAAKEEGRSLSNYITSLMMKDCREKNLLK